MMYYYVTLYANRTDATATQADYGQWYEARDSDEDLAGVYLPVSSPKDKSEPVAVHTMPVYACDAITACRKYQHWQAHGLDAAWLLLPNNDNERKWPTYTP